MEKKKLSLPKQIGIALLLGILAGYAFYMLGIPEFTTNYLKPFGTIFVNLLKFIVVPVVLLSMIDGIISMGDMKKVGSVGWKTVAYFLVTTAAACVIGLVFANLFNNAGWFPTLALEDGAVWDKATSANFMDTLVAIFPSNMWKSFTDANMLQVIVIALMFGGGILAAGEKGKLAKDLVSTLYAVIERVMAFIIALSPIRVFTSPRRALRSSALLPWCSAARTSATLSMQSSATLSLPRRLRASAPSPSSRRHPPR